MSVELGLLVSTTVCAGVAALFAIFCFLRTRQLPHLLTLPAAAQMLRAETEIVRGAVEQQSGGLRQELGNSLKGFQQLTLAAFGTLRDGINAQVRGFGERLRGCQGAGNCRQARRAVFLTLRSVGRCCYRAFAQLNPSEPRGSPTQMALRSDLGRRRVSITCGQEK
jgi:hypothetical protein